MKRRRPLCQVRGINCVSAVLLGALTMVFVAAISAATQQNGPDHASGQAVSSAPMQQAALAAPAAQPPAKKSSLDLTKDDAAQLSVLADKLRDELSKMNVNVFSLDVIQKTEEVEKLAKKIKGEAGKP